MHALILASAPPPRDYPRNGLPACLYHRGWQVELDRSVTQARVAGANAIRIITGYRADLVREHCVGQDVTLIYNPLWASDACAGIESAAGDDADLWIITAAGDVRLPRTNLPQLRTLRQRAHDATRGQRCPPATDAFAFAGLQGLGAATAAPALPYATTAEARLAPQIPPRWRSPRGHRPCTASTARCAFWNWSDEPLRPPCCTRHLRELLIFTDRLLTRHGIRHWLDWGPFLGAVREGALVPWDFDVDFGVMLHDRDNIAALRGEITAAGHVLNLVEDHIWRIHFSPTNQLHADLFPWHLEGDRLELAGKYADDGPFPPHWLQQMAPVRLFGHDFLAPAPHEEFLARHRYGPDFRTPVRYSDPPAGPMGAATAYLQRQEIRRRFRINLQRLHDVLAETALADFYWLTFGQFLGAVRDGDLLPHDDFDADFAFHREHHGHFLASAPALVQAGFRPRWCYRNHRDDIVEYSFELEGAKFDFFLVEPAGDHFTTYCFGRGREYESCIPAHGLAARRWLERDWLMPDDADTVLTALYGDWRTPRADWDYIRDDRSQVSARRWTAGHPERWQALGLEAQPRLGATDPQAEASATGKRGEAAQGTAPI